MVTSKTFDTADCEPSYTSTVTVSLQMDDDGTHFIRMEAWKTEVPNTGSSTLQNLIWEAADMGIPSNMDSEMVSAMIEDWPFSTARRFAGIAPNTAP